MTTHAAYGSGLLSPEPRPADDPVAVLHDRLEGSPRADDFARALRAEVRDAAWMLSCQLRSGEFQGDDSGSPAYATVNMATTRIRKFRASGAAPVLPVGDDVPLEALVERRPIPFKHGALEVSLDLRLLMGRQWIRMAAALGDFTREFIAHYPVAAPTSVDDQDALVSAHWEAKCLVEAVAGHRMDGGRLYEQLTANPPRHVEEEIPALATRTPAVRALEQRFIAWFQRVFYQPSPADGQDAWEPSRMEYQFSCAAPSGSAETVLTGDEYYHGHLDWYNLDVGRAIGGAAAAPNDTTTPATELQTVLPVPIAFDGMPNPRWWSFEDRRTNFGEVTPKTTDVAKLLFIEFGLQYGNDWSVIPYTMPLGSIAKLRGMAVTNAFGERLWIEAAGSRGNESWQKWGLFQLDASIGSTQPADPMILLLPTPAKVQEGRPLEKVFIVRDEMANMVWGVEETICLATGETKPGAEAARETGEWFRAKSASVTALDPIADVQYQVMTRVPEHWIPFIPVHLPNSIRDIQLQRGAMLRTVDGAAAPRPIRPRTSILRTHLDTASGPHTFFLLEEEVPRTGISITTSYNRARWRDGSVWTWLGMRKQTGRGERTSGLAFDQAEPVAKKKS